MNFGRPSASSLGTQPGPKNASILVCFLSVRKPRQPNSGYQNYFPMSEGYSDLLNPFQCTEDSSEKSQVVVSYIGAKLRHIAEVVSPPLVIEGQDAHPRSCSKSTWESALDVISGVFRCSRPN